MRYVPLTLHRRSKLNVRQQFNWFLLVNAAEPTSYFLSTFRACCNVMFQYAMIYMASQ
jgi:hypothetical protein